MVVNPTFNIEMFTNFSHNHPYINWPPPSHQDFPTTPVPGDYRNINNQQNGMRSQPNEISQDIMPNGMNTMLTGLDGLVPHIHVNNFEDRSMFGMNF